MSGKPIFGLLVWPLKTGLLQIYAHKDTANTRQNKNIKDPQEKNRLGTVSKNFTGGLKLESPKPKQNVKLKRLQDQSIKTTNKYGHLESMES